MNGVRPEAGFKSRKHLRGKTGSTALGVVLTIAAVALTACIDHLIGREWPMGLTTTLNLIGISSVIGALLFGASVVAGRVASACPAP